MSVELSLVIPCYNEADSLPATVPPLARVFQQAGISLQLVLVDNGSTDRTGQIIDQLMAGGLPITKTHVPVNQGQGLGLLSGFELCHGRAIGYLSADGQVAPEDVVRVYRALQTAGRPVLAKARRRYRRDSWIRKIVSIGYNALMQIVFGGLPCLDVNGNPKFLPAEMLRLLELQSRDWFLEAEVMLKVRHLQLPVIEIDVFGRPRGGGHSHVRAATVMEFLRNILAYRRGGPWREWRRRVTALGLASQRLAKSPP